MNTHPLNQAHIDQMRQSKIDARERLKSAIASVSAADRTQASVVACSLLTSSPEFAAASYVMIFLSTPDEIDTSPIALRCWQEGKTVVVPRIISWQEARMLPVEINSLSDRDLRTGTHGLREPIAGTPVEMQAIDLAVIPGLGFTIRGDRIGRGKGFYDRFLGSSQFLGVSTGLCFEQQVVETLPMEPHDVPVAMLVTQRGIRRMKTNCFSA
jgi:5-formyltetrahydrofolate cyclo-ligase